MTWVHLRNFYWDKEAEISRMLEFLISLCLSASPPTRRCPGTCPATGRRWFHGIQRVTARSRATCWDQTVSVAWQGQFTTAPCCPPQRRSAAPSGTTPCGSCMSGSRGRHTVESATGRCHAPKHWDRLRSLSPLPLHMDPWLAITPSPRIDLLTPTHALKCPRRCFVGTWL